MTEAITLSDLIEEKDIILVDSCVINPCEFIKDTHKLRSFREIKEEDVDRFEKALEIGAFILGLEKTKIVRGMIEEYDDYLEILKQRLKGWNIQGDKRIRGKKYNGFTEREIEKWNRINLISYEKHNLRKILSRKIVNPEDKAVQEGIFKALVRWSNDYKIKEKPQDYESVCKKERYTDEELVSTAITLAVNEDIKVGIISEDRDIVKLLRYFCVVVLINPEFRDIKEQLVKNKIGTYSMFSSYQDMFEDIGYVTKRKKLSELETEMSMPLDIDLVTFDKLLLPKEKTIESIDPRIYQELSSTEFKNPQLY